MALYKYYRQDNGVTTSYHRIAFLHITTNRQNSIAVFSYVDEESRNMELNGDGVNPYKTAVTYETTYDPEMTIETAYNYLKTLPQCEGATDV